MISEEKLKLMTKAALYEQSKDGKQAIKASKYFINDYIGRNIILNEIGVTIAYIMALVLVMILKMDTLVEDLADIDYKALGILIFCVYVVVLIVFFIIGYFVFKRRYLKLRHSVAEYNENLKEIIKIQKDEERSLKEDINLVED